jgi:hypothetical protein
MGCPSEVTVVARGMVTGPVFEGGIPPEKAAVLRIWVISAFCAVARMANGRKRRFAVPIMT